jgi:hypothetical protein
MCLYDTVLPYLSPDFSIGSVDSFLFVMRLLSVTDGKNCFKDFRRLPVFQCSSFPHTPFLTFPVERKKKHSAAGTG